MVENQENLSASLEIESSAKIIESANEQLLQITAIPMEREITPEISLQIEEKNEDNSQAIHNEEEKKEAAQEEPALEIEPEIQEIHETELFIDEEHLQDRNILSKKKSSKQNLRNYKDLLNIIRNKSSCEWHESRYSLPMKSFTPSCFWFIVCANHFPIIAENKKEEIAKSVVNSINSLEFPVLSRLPRQNWKLQKAENEENKVKYFELLDKMTNKFKEVIHKNDCFELTGHEEMNCSNRSPPYKSAYTKEDDEFLIEMRKMVIEKYDSFFPDEEDQQISNYDMAMACKQLPLEYFIELLKIDEIELKRSNEEKFQRLIENFCDEDKNALLLEKQQADPNNILKDLEFLSTTEFEFLNYLEAKQQQDLALLNNEMYDENKNVPNENSLQLPDIKQEKIEKIEKSDENGKNEKVDKTEIMENEPNSETCCENCAENKNNCSKCKNKPGKFSATNPTKKPNKIPKIIKDDIVCQVCNDGDYSEDNMIVFCSKCNISVHQKCYELQRIPAGDWICLLCRTFAAKGKYLRCPLCTKRGGVMKPTSLKISQLVLESTNPSYTEFQKKCVDYYKIHNIPEKTLEDAYAEENIEKNEPVEHKNDESYEEKLYYNFQTMKDITPDEISEEPLPAMIWIHLSCGLWTPEVFLDDKKNTITIKGVENIDKKRFNLMCSICKGKKAGACVQCSRGKCQFSFHPECARRANHYMEIKEEEKLEYCIFCYRHTPLKLKRLIEMKNKKYKKEIIKFCHNLEKFHDNYHYEQKLKETNISDKKKYIQNYISKIMKENKKKDKEFISTLLGFMKRQPEYLFQINLSKNLEVSGKYTLIDVKIPKKIHLKTNISRSDEIWKNFKYKNLNPAQLYKRYRKIIVGTKIHKNINSIKKLTHLKEIADMRAIKKIMNIPKDDEDFYIKDKVYETRKNIKPPAPLLPHIKPPASIFFKKKPPAIQQIPIEIIPEEIDNNLYCICKRKYEEGEKMMACDKCDDWMHFDCIGYQGDVESELTKGIKFICMNCDLKDDEETRRLRKQEYEKLFVKYYQCQESIVEKQKNLQQNVVEDANIHENSEESNQEDNFNENENKIDIEILIENNQTDDLEVSDKKIENIENFNDQNNSEKNNFGQENEIIDTEISKPQELISEENQKSSQKEGEIIQFNCITKAELQIQPQNNFKNKKITDFFHPFSNNSNVQKSLLLNEKAQISEPTTNCNKNGQEIKKKQLLPQFHKENHIQNIHNIQIVQNVQILQNFSPSLQKSAGKNSKTKKKLSNPMQENLIDYNNTPKKPTREMQQKLDAFIKIKKKPRQNRKKAKQNRKAQEKIRNRTDTNKTIEKKSLIKENCVDLKGESVKKRGRKKKVAKSKQILKIEKEIPEKIEIISQTSKENTIPPAVDNNDFRSKLRKKQIKKH